MKQGDTAGSLIIRVDLRLYEASEMLIWCNGWCVVGVYCYLSFCMFLLGNGVLEEKSISH